MNASPNPVFAMVDDLLERLIEPGRTALARCAEAERAHRLARGDISGITAPVGIAINALVFLSSREWLDGLFELRKALQAGLDKPLGEEVMRLVVEGLDQDVENDRAVRAEVFSSSSLALFRIVEVMLRGHVGGLGSCVRVTATGWSQTSPSRIWLISSGNSSCGCR